MSRESEETAFLRNARFEWDINKEQLNLEKHSFSFCDIKQSLIDNFDSTVQFDATRNGDERIQLLMLDEHKKSWSVILKIVSDQLERPIVFRVISIHRKDSGNNYKHANESWRRKEMK